LGPVPHHGAAQFPGSGYAQSAGFKAVGEPNSVKTGYETLSPRS
jgi:hypothetical protein